MSRLKFLAATTALFLATLFSAKSESPFNFLRFTSNARAAALAGSYVSITDDPAGLFYNPACVSTASEQDKNFSATFIKHILDVNSGNAVYNHALENNGAIAGFLSYTNYGSFDYADAMGQKSGETFGANDFTFGATYSNILDSGLYYGVTAKLAFFQIEKVSTSAFAVDAGLLYKLKDGRTTLGLSVLNAGGQMSKIGEESESLPLDVRLGVSHRLKGLPLLANLNFHHLNESADNFFEKFKSFSLGGELYLGKYVQVRIGYDNYIRQNVYSKNDKGMTGITAGFGIKAKTFNLDYGFAQYGSSAYIHKISFATEL